MTEEEARSWFRARFDVSRETSLARFAELLRAEARVQNLVAASTLDTLWARHLVDSAQLVPLAARAGAGAGAWLDVGSGAGLPGMVVALLTDRPTVLVEPRARRVMFLRDAADALAISRQVSIVDSRVEAYRARHPAAVISARAVADMGRLIASAVHCADSSTIWLLPKGRSVHSEVEAARNAWQGVFHVEPSVTAPDSGIVVAREVRPR